MTARDDRFRRVLAGRLGPQFHDVRRQAGAIERAQPSGVARPGGEGKVAIYAVHHTTGEQSLTWDQIWRLHVETNGWDTGGYNALVDRHGNLYHTVDPSRMSYGAGSRWNPITLHVCALGDYRTTEPSAQMLNTIYQWLITCDDVIGYQPWRAHGDLKQTACPGAALRRHVQAMNKAGSSKPRPARYGL